MQPKAIALHKDLELSIIFPSFSLFSKVYQGVNINLTQASTSDLNAQLKLALEIGVSHHVPEKNSCL